MAGEIIFKGLKKLSIQAKSVRMVAASENLSYGARSGRSSQKGDNGTDLLIGQAPDPPQHTTEAEVLDAYIGRLKEKAYTRIKWGGLEEQLFLVIKTRGLVGKEVTANIIDRDGIISGKKMGSISVMQGEHTALVALTGKVRNDGFAVIPFMVKSTEKKTTDLWREQIGQTPDKKARLCILVDAHSGNADLTVTYRGNNPKEDTGPTAGKSNYWLDTANTWFELRRKNPVIILDAGHGDNNAKNSVFDPGAVDGTEYEKDYALILADAVNDELINNGFEAYMTREGDINVDPQKPINWRYEFANEKKGDIFISFHLDSGKNSNVFSVYQQGKGNETESKAFAGILMDKLAAIVTVPSNSIRQVKGYTRYNTLGVLNNFNGKVGILMEFGGIASDTNREGIKTNRSTIAQAFVEAIKEYANEAF